MNKQTLVFYYGYSSIFGKDKYGSEIALINLSRELSKKYNIYFLTLNESEKYLPNTLGFDYRMISYPEYLSREFDILIISRYINFFIYFPIRSKKVYLWLHDVGYQHYYQGQPLYNSGKYLIENLSSRIDGIVYQTQWHTSLNASLNNTSIPKYIIGNGINTSLFTSFTSHKVPFRFIYTSSPKRGLDLLLRMFPRIREVFPLAELYIFRGPEEFTPFQLSLIQSMSYIKYCGSKSNGDIAIEFMKAEVWLYPTNFSETYCISALEAQAAGCLCICTNLASLPEVIGNSSDITLNRGILLYSKYDTEEYIQECISALKKAYTLRTTFALNARQWALQQDWNKRASVWHSLISS